MAFRTQPTAVPLGPEDVIRLQQILTERDAAAALAFCREVIADRIRRRQDDSHRPPFEGGIRIEKTPGFFKDAD